MKPGRLFPAAAFVFWAVMMSLLVRSRWEESRSAGSGAVLSLLKKNPHEESWYSIFHGPRKIGFGQVSISADTSGGVVIYRVDLYVRLHAPAAVAAQGELILHDPGGIETFSCQVRSGKEMLSMSGRAEGEDLVIGYDLGGHAPEYAAALPALSAAPAGTLRVPLSAAAREGESLRYAGEEVIGVLGVLIPARRYVVSSAAGEVTLMLGERGGILCADFPGGIRVLQEPRALAERM
jgi:hypothetical protein